MGFKKIDHDTLSKLHQVEIEILDEVVRVCEKNDINYFLIGGTLLGAVRHKGFIPWDDDIDVGMLRTDYNKFLEICETELKDQYYLDSKFNNKDSYLPFSKIRKKNTLINEEASAHLETPKGIFVDIFPFDNTNNKYGFLFKLRSLLIQTIIETEFYKKKISSKRRHPILSSCLAILPQRSLLFIQKNLLVINKNNNSKYITNFVGAYSCTKESVERMTAFPLKKIIFEKKEYNSFNDVDKYLTNIYGDYMQLPPEDKRVNHSALDICFDLKNRKN